MDRSDIRGSGSLLLDNYHGSSTYTEVIHEEPTSSTPSTGTSDGHNSTTANIRLRLTKNTTTKNTNGRRVSWTQDTVDNELMNKKKSKCCCQFQKAKSWDESSDEDENDDKECAHCKGHKKTDFNSHREHTNQKQSELVSKTENNHCNHENHDLPKE